MTRHDCTLDRGRSASPSEVTEFEASQTPSSKVTITCEPCTWHIHADLLASKVWGGQLSKGHPEYYDNYGEYRDVLEEEGADLQETPFIFARLLQFLYYGTYSFKSDDPIPSDENLTRPGFPGLSPATIVRSAFTDFDETTFTAMKLRDDTLSTRFGDKIHIFLFDLGEHYAIRGLKDYTLKQYSTFQFENHKALYFSVTDKWPHFPFFSYQTSDTKILRLVVPHVARFLEEVRGAAEKRDGREAREVLRWVSGVDHLAREKSLVKLLDGYLAMSLEEQAGWDIFGDGEGCEGCEAEEEESSESEDGGGGTGFKMLKT